MKSIKTIFKTGIGPSSSHTMGPSFAASKFLSENKEADFIKAVLFGSLAKTGKGHGTDRAILQTLCDVKCEISFDTDSPTPVHPNTVRFFAYKEGRLLSSKCYYSIGGGEIREDGDSVLIPKDQYELERFSDIAECCKKRNIRLSDYVFEHEDEDIKEFLLEVWKTMQSAIQDGLSKRGTLPGGLEVERKAQFLYNQKHNRT